jgi:hypothetical protein
MLTSTNSESPATGNGNRRLTNVIRFALVVALGVLSFAKENAKVRMHTTGHYHLVGHILAFGFVELLIVKNARSMTSRLAWTGGMILFGCSVEILQHLVYRTPIEFNDMWADGLGIMLGLMTCLILNGLSDSPRLVRDN